MRKLPPHTSIDKPVRVDRVYQRPGLVMRAIRRVFRIPIKPKFVTTQVEAVHDKEHCLRCLYEKRLKESRKEK